MTVLTRERILTAAAGEFAKNGYAGTSLEALAAQLGVTKPAVYYYFRSKQAILEALVSEVGEQILAAAEQAATAAPSASDALRLLVHEHVRFISTHTEVYSVLLHARSSLTAEQQEQLQDGEQSYAKYFYQAYGAGVDDGSFRSLPPALVVASVLGALNASILWFRWSGGRMTTDEFAAVFTDTIFSGALRPDPGAALLLAAGSGARAQHSSGSPTEVAETGGGAARPRSKKSSATRAEILTVATRLFSEQGYHDTKLEDIAHELGIAKSAIHYHFHLKQEILGSATLGTLRDGFAEVASKAASIADPQERLLARLAAHTQVIVEDRSLLLLAIRERNHFPPAVLGEVEDLEREYLGTFADDLVEVAAALDAGLRVSPEINARLLVGMADAVLDWYEPAGPLSIDEVASGLMDLYLHGLAR